MVVIAFRNKIFLVGFIVFLIDQISKFIVVKNFDYTTNTGAAFGILQGQNFLLIIISLIVLCFIVYYSFRIKKQSEIVKVAFGFLMGGLLGNLADRIFRGFVIDFIDFGFWPSFNLADTFNTIAVILILIFYKD